MSQPIDYVYVFYTYYKCKMYSTYNNVYGYAFLPTYACSLPASPRVGGGRPESWFKIAPLRVDRNYNWGPKRGVEWWMEFLATIGAYLICISLSLHPSILAAWPLGKKYVTLWDFRCCIIHTWMYMCFQVFWILLNLPCHLPMFYDFSWGYRDLTNM